MELLYNSMQKAGINDQDIDVVFNQIKTDMLDFEKLIIDND